MRLDELRRLLAVREPRSLSVESLPPAVVPAGGLHHAAVLVPLFQRGEDLRVLLTLRRSDLRNHPGQVSFPGGSVEPGEATLAAALREAREEVGMDPGQVEILGRLDDEHVLLTAFCLTPWVGVVPDRYPYVADPREVEAILDVSLSSLDEPGVHRKEEQEMSGTRLESHRYVLPEVTIWGATARVLHQLSRLWSGR